MLANFLPVFYGLMVCIGNTKLCKNDLIKFYCAVKLSSLLSFARASTPSQSQTGLGPRIYLIVIREYCTAAINAGSDGVDPTSCFVIQNRQSLASCGA